ncbi:MAG TPA: DUF3089 domain-containing protein [Solirubrobacteraceae bacterium]|jgi:hypothetical protein|nr:DUF3089 domain-containing protein [Solirubrobacteraceae bacterium]
MSGIRLLTRALALGTSAFLLLALSASASAKVGWLCRPGEHPSPCAVSLSTTVVTPTLQPRAVEHPARVRHPAIDCFYVYPTVSDQKTTLANLHVDPEERSIALYQVARYSQYCRVFAPMYRQVTLAALSAGNMETPAELTRALADVTNAFTTYLTRYSHGRGFVLIGHSQGSFVLKELIAKQIDRRPALRRRLVSAILLGGNVLVKRGRRTGGTFSHVPACRSAAELGCVIAFSTFDQPPPADSMFGRTTSPGDQVLCTNPAALAGGAAKIDPILPSRPFAPGTLIAAATSLLHLTQPKVGTEWISEPGAYRAHCSSAGGADVLQITPLGGAQTPTPSPTPAWGLHLLDANIEMGNLLSVMRSEAAAYTRRR